MIDIREELNLPGTWAIVRLEEICDKITDGTHHSPANGPSGDYKYITAKNIKPYGLDLTDITYVDKLVHREIFGRCDVQKDDVLYVKDGATTGRVVINPLNEEFSLLSSVGVFRPGKAILPKYLMYALQSNTVKDRMLANVAGVAITRLTLKKLKASEIPLAPLPQQTRILAEIEKQFSRLDEAITNLKRVKANLKRYKAAVLKAAVEGKLTDEWRRQHPDVEPAGKLLERILAERRKGAGKGKYKEPAAPETANLPELPVGWVWTNFEQLAEAIPSAIKAGPFGSALKKTYYVSEGYKIYGQEQVIRDDPYYGDYYIDEERYQDLLSCAVKPSDLLISLVGTIGRVLILPDDIEPGIINPRLVKVSLDRQLANPLFIKIYLQSTYVKTLFTMASHGGTMDILNLGILKEIPIPLPPIKEQTVIVEEFERISSIESELSSAIESNRARADRLRQSILKQAFSGQLVPQDPNDEPASVLLGRIRGNANLGARHAVPLSRSKQPKRAQHAVPLQEPKPVASDDFASLDAVLAAILGHMQPGREYSRAELADALGLTTGRWNAAIQELKRRGQVRQVGERRGATYSVKQNK